MMDLQTETLWCHILGQAMAGPLKDTRLQIIPGELTTWENWKQQHPATSVLNLSRTHEDFTKDIYENPDDFLYGWRLGAKAFASTFTVMRANPVQNLDIEGDPLLLTFDTSGDSPVLFSRKLGDTVHRFEHHADSMRDAETGSTWDLGKGTCVGGQLKGEALEHVVGIVSFTRSWSDFHPDSEYIQP
jgi:hypothetical protein